MAKLIYFTPTSLDGYIADEPGNFDWAAPDEEAYCNDSRSSRPMLSRVFPASFSDSFRVG